MISKISSLKPNCSFDQFAVLETYVKQIKKQLAEYDDLASKYIYKRFITKRLYENLLEQANHKEEEEDETSTSSDFLPCSVFENKFSFHVFCGNMKDQINDLIARIEKIKTKMSKFLIVKPNPNRNSGKISNRVP